ncbi:hypothetical protein [Pontibacter sp. G13]|uniref:hypothetical protein n=1 Tax=Pontibacter sp. G13 TaxID=3074898 RepID=UPI00288AE80F|nr:hypothetical protein [Pontibacter sp. G13]WNJ21142.1 hypothetical protein RJD25_11800 [Pontibacter sp. G13]
MESSLQTALHQFFAHASQFNIKGILDALPPVYFEWVPRAKMEQMMEGLNDDPVFSVELADYQIKQISPITSASDTSYARVEYGFYMTLTLNRDEVSLEQEKELVKLWEDRFGKTQVGFDHSDGVGVIRREATLIAMEDHHVRGWKLMEYKPHLRRFVEELVPYEVRMELGFT